MNRTEELKRELMRAVNEYNLTLGKIDAEIQQQLWHGARNAAAKAFEYQVEADVIRASKSGALAEFEAKAHEAGADVFRDLSRDLIQQAETVPAFSKLGHIRVPSNAELADA